VLTMTSHVQKLAEAPCDGGNLECCALNYMNPDGVPLNCLSCHDTGALVPGLRERCPEMLYVIKDPNAYEPLELLLCAHKDFDDGEPPNRCQGRGWMLIPEQMGVLVRFEKPTHIAIEWEHDLGSGWWRVRRVVRADTKSGYLDTVGVDNTPEEALAHAICQAKGIDK